MRYSITQSYSKNGNICGKCFPKRLGSLIDNAICKKKDRSDISVAVSLSHFLKKRRDICFLFLKTELIRFRDARTESEIVDLKVLL